MTHDRLSIVFAGEVDHGKSTLIGHLLAACGAIPQSAIDKVRLICKGQGQEFEHAFLLDAFEEEQRQGVTIDTCQIQFASPKRRYRIIDAPGHYEFLKNMVTGSAQADAAVLVVDAVEGVTEQTRRHGYLLKFIGVEQAIVAVNKMDLADFSEGRFEEIREEIGSHFKAIGLHTASCVPVSAREGAGLLGSAEKMPWHVGPSLMEALDALEPIERANGLMRFAVQDIYREGVRRIAAGRVESGRIAAGDRVVLAPSNRTATVAEILRWQAPPLTEATAGESVGLIFAESAYIERGHILSNPNEAPKAAQELSASLFWMGRERLTPATQLTLKLLTQEVSARVARVDAIVDPGSLESRPAEGGAVGHHEFAAVAIELARPIAADLHAESPRSGRFVLVHDGIVCGGGIVTGIEEKLPRQTPKSNHIAREFSRVTPRMRALQNGHCGAVVWLTGLPSSGKSTVARHLETRLFELGCRACVVDGDNLRHGLNSDLGFSAADRAENIRRAGEVAGLMCEAGMIAITAFISPYRADRERARKVVSEGQFIEVFVSCPIEVCESRDPKGNFRRARAGELTEFTGVSAPYEEPEKPDVVVTTDSNSVDNCVEEILGYLKGNRILHPEVS